MNLQFFNTPQPEKFDPSILPKERPVFLDYEPNFTAMEEAVKPYKDFKNLLLLGNGGSVSIFEGLLSALQNKTTKQVYIVSTVDPDYIYELKQKLSPTDTVILSLSKSGKNTTQMESYMQFIDYPTIIVTESGTSLDMIAKRLDKHVVISPPIGDRYAANAETVLLPLLLSNIDIVPVYKGMKEFQAMSEQDNIAWQVASVLWQLEQQGVLDVFVPMYNHRLSLFGHLISQLCHESFGKDGKGQTYIAAEGPEWQHHMTQRFFGGPKNVAGFFISLNHYNHALVTTVPENLQDIPMRDSFLSVLHGIPLDKALEFEVQGNIEDANRQHIPLLHLQVSDLGPGEMGRFTAFWQLSTVYASALRNVDPFDQPQVEASKNISFEERKKYSSK